MAISSEESFYILRFDRDAYNAALESGNAIGDEGVEEAFDIVAEVSDKCVAIYYSPISMAHFLVSPLASKQVNG